jgi:cation diffusion facilitator CzcD-associated flavoprotein CzcO
VVQHDEGADVDVVDLRSKYAIEREKRLRADGPDQYLEPTGRFEGLLEDTYTEFVEREPLKDAVTVAVIGGGWAGLCTAAALVDAGVDDVRIIEEGGDFGGAWYWNRYPGAMCDTAAMIYLPLLEETGYLPSQKYTSGSENFEHAQRIANHYGLYRNAMLSTEVTSLTWRPDDSVWRITTNRGDDFTARFVSMGTGPLNRPKLPGIEGMESFRGHMFHTARWDYAYTGGDPSGARMDRLGDKRVGIIGTGATAVQCIPHLAADAAELYVFQRTPSSIDIRNNHVLTDEYVGDLQPGWQRQWRTNFATLQTGGFANEDLVMDGWTDIAQRIRDRIVEEVQSRSESGEAMGPEVFLRAYEDSDDDKMNEIRSRVDDIVDDPETASALKPWYRQLCKRPCFHDEYLQSYNNENTHLVDTDGQGVSHIDESGVWANGIHYELDCVVLASGFEVNLAHSATYETVGSGGVALSDYWSDGMVSLHGIHVKGYPNLFVVGLNQGANLVSNVTHNLTEAGATVAAVVSHAVSTGATEVEPTQDAQDNWVAQFDGSGVGFIGNADCTPGYYNNEGRPPGRREQLNASGYAGGPVAYFNHIQNWRSSGEFEGLEFR